MQKLNFTKLQLKKNTTISSVKWEESVVEIKCYLPIEEKMGVVERILNASIDANSYANVMQIEINTVLECVFAYTNIVFTDKQKENKYNLYDLLCGSGLWNEIQKELKDTGELQFIEEAVRAQIKEFYEYKNSVLGILDAVNQDYSNLNFDAENIQKNLADPNNLALLKDVVTKLG